MLPDRIANYERQCLPEGVHRAIAAHNLQHDSAITLVHKQLILREGLDSLLASEEDVHHTLIEEQLAVQALRDDLTMRLIYIPSAQLASALATHGPAATHYLHAEYEQVACKRT